MSDADALDGERIAAAVRAGGGGRRFLLRDEVGSTQDLAFAMADEGAPDGSVVLADGQTAGRGRLGRRWESPPGAGLWFSRVVRPGVPPPPAPLLVAATAVALAAVLERETGVVAALRWPNDVLMGGLKVAGMLIETRDFDPGSPVLVLGVGVNVSQAEGGLAEDLRGTATSLRGAGGRTPDRTGLLCGVLRSLDDGFADLARPGGAERLDAAYVRRAAFVGEAVQLLDGDAPREGVLLEASPVRGVLLRGAVDRGDIRVRPEHARALRPSGPRRGRGLVDRRPPVG